MTLSGLALAKPAAKKSAGSGPDKAYLQKIWDGWNSLDGSKQVAFYAKGPHTYFDVAPLKYSNFDEYAVGVTKGFADYSGAKFDVNDDAEVHSFGADNAWVAATVKGELKRKSGKVEMLTLRWTAIFHKEEGKWIIVHEHVSVPMQ